MSTTASSSTTTRSQLTQQTQQQQAPSVVLVPGEASDSVTVQSQLATSTVAGDVQHHSNLTQVVTDLSAAHNAHSGWVEQETAKIAQWGQGEIARILAQTKGTEEQLVLGAKQKQTEIDNKHKAELAKLVQTMDLQKAAELKELEDGLQRQIQAALSTSKNEINRIETEMNAKKMDILKQSQLKSAQEIDQLSNLVVTTKLVPSTTRTVIETATNTGNVTAIATGGEIHSGQATSETVSSQRIAAIPNAGMLQQQTDVKLGDMVKNSTGEKVGDGAIVTTMTNVVEQGKQQQQPAVPSTGSNVSGGAVRQSGASGNDLLNDRDLHSGATQRPGDHVPIDAGRQAGSTINAPGGVQLPSDRTAATDKERRVDAAYGKNDNQSGGLLGKVRTALTHASEPKSSDSTRRV